MDEYSAALFADQDQDQSSSASMNADNGSPASSPHKHSVTGHVRDKLRNITSSRSSSPSPSLQDRLLAKLLQQVIPLDDGGTEQDLSSAVTRHERPPFSLPAMTNNFRRFNARIGIVFHFQNSLFKLFSWRNPTHTWSFLCVYSFICLDPYLLPILPFVVILFFIMIPAFITRHPPPPPNTSTSSTTPYYSYEGPALAPARTIKPVPETSKDFFQNMRDLQNSMADFSVIHDAAVTTIAPATNFSDEKLSSMIFLVLMVLTSSLFITAHLLPWRAIFLIAGNAAVLSAHPRAEMVLRILKSSEHEEGSEPFTIFGYSIPTTPTELVAALEALIAPSLDSVPEEREVEIFELQHKIVSPFSGNSEWESFLFTPTPYDPLSPSRISGDRPKGTRFFEDISAPRGWAWKSKKWELDLECREWVMERMVTGVEFEVPSSKNDEEVGGWVWDLPLQNSAQSIYSRTSEAKSDDGSTATFTTAPQRKDRGSRFSEVDWEEATQSSDRTGEWRRRRWVRMVRRIELDEKTQTAS